MRYLLVLMMLAACSTPKPTQSPSPDEVIIRDLRKQSNEAIARHDSVAVADVWMNNFLVIASGDDMAVGKEENRKLFTSIFKARPDVVYERTPTDIEVMADWGMASEAGTWEGSWSEQGGRIEIGGTYYAKWHKIDGNWLIRTEVFTPTHCQGGNYCNNRPQTTR